VDSDPALAIGAGPAVPGAAGELAGAGKLLDDAPGAGLGVGGAPLGVADGSGVACATTAEESASTLATICSRPPVAPTSRGGGGGAGVSASSTAAWRGAAVAAATAASIARALVFEGGASALPQGRAFSKAAKRGSSGVGCSMAAIVPTELKVAERSASDATATRARRSSFSARRAGTRSLRRFP
jgi:hypothetical protein